jgi:dihydroorotase
LQPNPGCVDEGGELVAINPHDAVPSVQLVLRGGRIVTPGGLLAADVLVGDGSIVGIVDRGTPYVLGAAEVVDVADRFLLPGLIDTHTHLREPGYAHKEDITTGTRAAAAGGYTTVVGMPNVDPPTNTVELYEDVIRRYEEKSLVDFNHNPSPTIPDEVAGLASAGALGFKVYMISDSARSYPHMPGIGIHDYGQLLEIAEAVGSTGLPLMVHPHTQSVMATIEARFWDQGLRDHIAYAQAFASYGGMVWDVAASFLVRLQEATGVRMHVLHLKTPRMARIIRDAKRSGQDVTAELNPVAVFLCNDWENIERLGPFALSTWTGPDATEPLWEAIRDGTIDVIGTDHAPHTRDEKAIGWTDMWKAAGGVPQIQDALSLFLTEVNRGRLSYERLAEVTSTRPAQIFGLYPKKGLLAVGSDADITVVDPARSRTIDGRDVLSKCGWTPFEGREVVGVPVHTLVRGRFVMRDGQVVGVPGWGRHARPSARNPLRIG